MDCRAKPLPNGAVADETEVWKSSDLLLGYCAKDQLMGQSTVSRCYDIGDIAVYLESYLKKLPILAFEHDQIQLVSNCIDT